MNLIKTKQIDGLDGDLSNLQSQIIATGQYINYFISGDATFSGEKTFTGKATFKTGVDIEGPLQVYNKGNFNSLGVGLPLETGAGFTGRFPQAMVHISGGNLRVDGGIYGTGEDGTLTQIIPYWIARNGTLYYSGLAGGNNGNVNLGFNKTGHVDHFSEAKLNVSGGVQVLETIHASGIVSGQSDAYFRRAFVTGNDGAFMQLTGGAGGGGGGGTTYTAGTGLALVGTEFNTSGSAFFENITGTQGVFTDELTISGVSVATGTNAGTAYTAGTGLVLIGTQFNTTGTGVFLAVSGNTGYFKDELSVGTGDTLLSVSGNKVEVSGELWVSGQVYITGSDGAYCQVDCGGGTSTAGATEAFVMFMR
tara:strand:+ start:3952 stop:5043 length:1092 start_codon:yes stop_codon:yes gene_type:complete